MILLPLGLPKEADDDFDKILMEIHENHDIYFDDPIIHETEIKPPGSKWSGPGPPEGRIGSK